MKTIILAAGRGSRMGLETDDKPKCLILYNGKPIIDYILEAMGKCRIGNIIVVNGYKKETLKTYLGGRDIRFVTNESFGTTNMVYSLFCAEHEMNDDLIISYGDIIYSTDILRQLIDNNNDFVVVVDKEWRQLWDLRTENPLGDVETMKINNNGNIVELGKKTNSYNDIEGQYIGLFKISHRIIGKVIDFYHSLDTSALYDGNDYNNMYMTSFIQLIIDNLMPVKAEIISGGWMEFDTIEDQKNYHFNNLRP